MWGIKQPNITERTINVNYLGFIREKKAPPRPVTLILCPFSVPILVKYQDVSKTFEHVEWVVLIFFAALFVMVGGLEAAGVMEQLSRLLIQVSDIHPILLGVGMIWTVAVLSALVDNIPITIALIPVIQNLGAEGIDVTPLWWALVFGAGFGGNGTIIGSTANIVVVSLSEKTRSPITSALWNRRGLPVMILACVVASLLYAIFFPWFTEYAS